MSIVWLLIKNYLVQMDLIMIRDHPYPGFSGKNKNNKGLNIVAFWSPGLA